MVTNILSNPPRCCTKTSCLLVVSLLSNNIETYPDSPNLPCLLTYHQYLAPVHLYSASSYFVHFLARIKSNLRINSILISLKSQDATTPVLPHTETATLTSPVTIVIHETYTAYFSDFYFLLKLFSAFRMQNADTMKWNGTGTCVHVGIKLIELKFPLVAIPTLSLRYTRGLRSVCLSATFHLDVLLAEKADNYYGKLYGPLLILGDVLWNASGMYFRLRDVRNCWRK